MSLENFNNLITEFCKSIDLADPLINDEGYYSFVLDGDQTIEIQYDFDSRMVILFCKLGQITSTNRNEVIKDILDANVLWRGTGGGTLGLDSSSGLITLSYQESADHMPYSRFEAILGLLISNAENWMHRISTESYAQENSEEQTPPSGSITV